MSIDAALTALSVGTNITVAAEFVEVCMHLLR
jgi:hypothetical protein